MWFASEESAAVEGDAASEIGDKGPAKKFESAALALVGLAAGDVPLLIGGEGVGLAPAW